jgi:MoxR-like ATPase
VYDHRIDPATGSPGAAARDPQPAARDPQPAARDPQSPLDSDSMTSLPEHFADPALPPAARIEDESRLVGELMAELGRVIVGQRAMLERMLIGLLADGHVLLEGVPGLAKTLAVRTLAATMSAAFHRIQFTPDLLPADLIGTMIYNQRSGDFTVQRGPIFTNLLLADEINRAPAKVQSALLEAMQEKQVTIGGQTFPLPELFLVLATQNPIEHEGTYPLPEAQVDRFMFKLVVTYPERRDERLVLDRMTAGPEPTVSPVLDPERILSARRLVQSIYADDRIKDYVLDVVAATRQPAAAGLADLAPMVEYGASPRAAIFLLRAAKAHAFLRGRPYVTPDDIKALGLDVLRHRVILTYRADAEGVGPDALLERILEAVPVP